LYAILRSITASIEGLIGLVKLSFSTRTHMSQCREGTGARLLGTSFSSMACFTIQLSRYARTSTMVPDSSKRMHQAYVLSNFKPIEIVSAILSNCYRYAARKKHTTLALSDSNKLNRNPSLITASEDIADHQVEAWLFHDIAQTSESCFLEFC
jgi:hypothetical protein